MKIKQVRIEHFGCLSGLENDFGEGLNVIYGENGAGKSTFFSFLKSAFYGFSRGGKQREKYLPWNGKKAEGSICFSEEDGQDWLLQVQFGKTARGDRQTMFHALTGEEKPLAGWPGKELFSMGEETFLKTACVGQAQLAISAKGQDEIAEKLANLEQTGEAALSYAACRKELDQMLTALRAKRGGGGLLNQAEAALEELSRREQAARQKSARAAELYLRLNKIEEELENCTLGLTQWEAFQKAEQKRQCRDYQQKISVFAQQEQGEQEEYEIYESLAREWQQEEEALLRLQEQQSPPSAPREPLCSREEFTEIMEKARKKPVGWIIAAFAATLVCIGLGWLVSPILYVGAVLLGAAGLFLALRKAEQPWEQYGASSALEFSQLYAESVRRHEACEAEILQQRKLEEQISRQKERLKAYQEKGEHLDCKTPGELFSLCSQRRERQAARRTAAQQRKTYEELLAKALNGTKLEEILEVPDADRPMLSEKELRGRQIQLTQERERLIQEQSHLFGEGERPEVLRAERMEWEEKRERYQKREQALRLAEEGLEHAYKQMEQQFGGALNKTAGALLAEMTQGRYQEARISRDYQVRLTEGSQAHALEQFSGGLYDQVYLAFRLAMLALMEGRTPILLDDVLMQYDDVRAERTMAALRRYAAEQNVQMILFTCRKRDLNLAKKLENVNCITIL